MKTTKICLIGAGPRALVTLNAIGNHAHKNRDCVGNIEITLIDPNTPGTGSHNPQQPEYLYTNTLASQVTAFYPTEEYNENETWITGPSFKEWEQQFPIQNDDKNEYPTEINPVDIFEGDPQYLPRAHLGKYLAWGYEQILSQLPPTLSVSHNESTAKEITPCQNGGFEITLDNGNQLEADYVFISTGHSTNRLDEQRERFKSFAHTAQDRNPDIGYFPQCYPLGLFADIAPHVTVAIQGLGLTAWDVIAELTEGRGGYYSLENNQMVYHASSLEPKIRVYSRQCLPSAARGINEKGVGGRHEPVFFTPDAIRGIRRQQSDQNQSPQLDFEKDLLPLLRKEMAFAYRSTKRKSRIESTNFRINEEEESAIAAEFNPFEGQHFSTIYIFREAFLKLLRDDLSEADKGNLSAPIKSATDVIRDCRATICEAVEFRGLTPESEKWFRNSFVPLMNRVSFGPPKFRNYHLLALFNAGVIDLACGPNSVTEINNDLAKYTIKSELGTLHADVLIEARLDPFLPDKDENPISQSLLQSGMARPYQNGATISGGFDITKDQRPIRADGSVGEGLWIIGYPTEGPIFYTHAIPRPELASGQHAVADGCVAQMFEHLRSSGKMTDNLSHKVSA